MSLLDRLLGRGVGTRTASPSPSERRKASVHTDDPSIYQIGSEILDLAEKHRAGLLSSAFWRDKLMDWSMKDQAFKVQLFRFVDTFPALRTPDDVHEHLIDYLTQPGVKLPPGMGTAIKAGGAAKGLFTKQVTSQIEGMAKNFIAGTDAQSALPQLRKLWDKGIAFSVDLLGEACVSSAEADMYRDKYIDLVTNLPGDVADWPRNERLETTHLGDAPRVNVSVKLSALSATFDAIDPDGATADVLTRLLPILEAARDRGVFINLDMEAHEDKDLTIDTLFAALEKIEGVHVGLAMQAYLKSGDADAKRVIEWAKSRKRHLTVRLVKGAYWDFEVIHAEMQGWPCPVWTTKRETDACFERMARLFLDATPTEPGEPGVSLALGSHNARSIASAISHLRWRGLPDSAIELQMLHGMAPELKAAGKDMGLRVREYVPVGEMIPGMAYLVRRLLENTSNESWLLASGKGGVSRDVLLASPEHGITPRAEPIQSMNGHAATLAAEHSGLDTLPAKHRLSSVVPDLSPEPFFTEPVRDFAEAAQREAFAAAIETAEVPRVANDATIDDADAALTAAHDAFPAWRDADPIDRSRVLMRIAALMRDRRDEIAGIIIKENGKDWRNADADVTEAIDFCEYYAREAVGLFRNERLGRFIGELDELFYQPRGVAVVISPWNFPLAIAAGMALAALVTGNTVILKPAEQTPGIARVLADLTHAAIRDVFGGDAHANVFRMLAGEGETVGAHLVRDPRVAIIAFTGSKAVGLDIIKAAGITTDEQPHVKKVVCEMGGKNAIIVDTSADLDEAVLGVRASAFGFAGQKCSACSRCIVVDPQGPGGPHITQFTDRLIESTRSLVVGNPLDPGTDVGPVIDDASRGKIVGFIERAKRSGVALAIGGDVRTIDADSPVQPKNLVPPHIFTGVPADHELFRDEVFGPVLAITHAPTFDEALRLANDSRYKLTGGVFSRMPAHLARARREFRVGNLYLNRTITGALVGRQPFGGFGMSGIGSKAGGPDYLLQFVEPRAIAENMMRQGFAPELG